MRSRLTKEEALAFLLTHIVVERQIHFDMNQISLFNLMNMASEASSRVNREQGQIPHEVVEDVARHFSGD
jgi:hypothetical protein